MGGEGGEVELAAIGATGGEDRQAADGALRVATERGAPTVAGVLASPRVGGAEEGDEGAGQQGQVPVEMAGFEMPELVADDHVAGRLVLATGLEQVAEQHHHAAAEEARRQGVE